VYPIIRSVLGDLNVVLRRSLTRSLRRSGVAARALFERLVRLSIRDEQPVEAVRVKRLLARCPWAASWIARALVLAGAEPVVSLYIRPNGGRARRPSGQAGAASA